MMKIPLIDLKAQQNSIQSEINKTLQETIETTGYIGGSKVRNFEDEFAQAHNVKHCIGVGNGTDAIFLVLKSMGIGRGDKVIVPAFSFIASSEAISATGAEPLFVDVSEKDFNIDIDQLEKKLQSSERVKAILVVHLYGRIADMNVVMNLSKRFNVKVIEDSAQAHLARKNEKYAGTTGDAGTFSFYPGKNLGAFGDAGCVVTDSDELAQKVRMLANHGRVKKYEHEFEGYNSRLDSLQAGVLSVKLKRLEKWTRAREAKAHYYQERLRGLQGLVLPEIPKSGEHSFHLYVVRVPEKRDEVLQCLKEQGVMAGIHYPFALHNLQAYSYMNLKPESYPVSTQLQNQVLSLPLFPEITSEQQDYVVVKLREALKDLNK